MKVIWGKFGTGVDLILCVNAKALLETYFRNGGQQAMINVLRRGDLEDAIAHPENHQSLMVRVGGFSARFVTLAPDVQREIASRTLY